MIVKMKERAPVGFIEGWAVGFNVGFLLGFADGFTKYKEYVFDITFFKKVLLETQLKLEVGKHKYYQSLIALY